MKVILVEKQQLADAEDIPVAISSHQALIQSLIVSANKLVQSHV